MFLFGLFDSLHQKCIFCQGAQHRLTVVQASKRDSNRSFEVFGLPHNPMYAATKTVMASHAAEISHLRVPFAPLSHAVNAWHPTESPKLFSWPV